MGKVNFIQTPGNYIILPPYSVKDQDSLNPDTDPDPSILSKSGSIGRFFLRLMSAYLVILWRVISSPTAMDMKQYRYLNFDKSHPLLLNYDEKVLGCASIIVVLLGDF